MQISTPKKIGRPPTHRVPVGTAVLGSAIEVLREVMPAHTPGGLTRELYEAVARGVQQSRESGRNALLCAVQELTATLEGKL